MILLPPSHTLEPRLIDGIYCFPSESTQLVKLDLLFEAGSAYQPQSLCALAANKLFYVATQHLDSARMAEFLDYRGVIVESDSQTQQSRLTLYFLRRYADELLPVVGSMLKEPAFGEDDFMVWRDKRRQEIAAGCQRTPTVARRLYYETLFGEAHPLGHYATVEDADRLDLGAVRQYYDSRYRRGPVAVVLAGAVDEALVNGVNSYIAIDNTPVERRPLAMPAQAIGCRVTSRVAGAVQATVRMGRVLPLRWDEPDMARLMLLNMLLGGYFGSRLMGNLREDKGYTYGIYSRIQLYRGLSVFFITTDVVGSVAEAAEKEILKEIEGLQHIGNEELQTVKQVMAGDFLRSVDGIFELSARFCDMYDTQVSELLTDHLREAIEKTTAAQLEELAQRLLCPEAMNIFSVGA